MKTSAPTIRFSAVGDWWLWPVLHPGTLLSLSLMWTTLQNISEISLTARYYMTLMPERGWKSKQLRHSVTISDWMCKPKMVYFLFHMIVYRSDSHSGHKPSLGNKKPTAHIFTPVGKYLDCSAQGPCCFCLSDRIIAEGADTGRCSFTRKGTVMYMIMSVQHSQEHIRLCWDWF